MPIDTHKLKEHLWEKLENGPFAMVGLRDNTSHCEPLTVQLDKDQADTLWFFISKDNRLAKGGAALVNFVSKGQDFFASLSGHATIDNNPAMIDKLWSGQVEAWFTGGKSDPKLALLRIDISGAELWEADVSLVGQLKMLLGSSIEAGEQGSHAVVTDTKI
ncbi:pyridoxamine 5'-phosphate oxidase family protein [Novosphingobium terrae]|uniref:pyridoxamine 5'-phosphate oxidase family protein n=1 Tax=Novosphingobium terrae TaxID=2726189 RepID=UPI00197F53A0|nr:pyridoxamine 5'-phosphate oxidase family protein [Novosphingobium terrae]